MRIPSTLRLICAYERRAIRRAYNDALHSLGFRGIIAYIISVLIGFTSLYLYRGKASMLEELEIWALSAAFPAVFVFLWYLFGASARIDQEQQVRLRSSGIDRPNYAMWDELLELELRQAASLWAEMEPTSYVPPGKPQLELHRLKTAMARDPLVNNLPITVRMKLMQTADLDAIPDAFPISRNDLIAYANSIGERPVFLFPDERIQAWPKREWGLIPPRAAGRQQFFQNETLQLTELFDDINAFVISDAVFLECTLRGPGVVILESPTIIGGIDLIADTVGATPEFLIADISTVAGARVFRKCILRKCKLMDIAIAGDKQTVENLGKNHGGFGAT